MSSYAEPSPTAIGLRALLAAVMSYRTATRAEEPPRATGASPAARSRRANRTSRPVGPAAQTGNTARDTADDAARGSAWGRRAKADAAANGTADPAGPPDDDGSGGEVWTLVRAAQGGDPEAFGRIYDRYVDLVFRYAYHRLGDRALAEDLTSETFVRALRRLDSLTYQGRDMGAWLVTITRNLILDHLKSSRHRMEVVTDDLRQADRATDGPEDAVLDKLTSATLLRCVRQLGAEQQECVVLRFLHGLSVAETAAIMGKNEGAIKALQHRAIRRLASLLPEDPR
jgi:RNA polymerase sigma-70 factor (TIGR02952 family)